MSKEYDWVVWDFLKHAMLRMGFAEHWVSVVLECISMVQYHILFEGDEYGLVCLSRGFCQGEPL